MKLRKMMLLIFLLLSFFAAEGMAADCRIHSVTALSPGGPTTDLKIVFSLEDIQGGQLFFKGQRAPDDVWIFYPASIVDGQGEVTIPNWPAGEFFEFSYYTLLGGVVRWTDPSCSALAYEGHFRVKAGDKFVPKNLSFISLLLLKGDDSVTPPSPPSPPPPPPALHSCVVVSSQKTATNGSFGNYRITLSLQKFDAPTDAMPYVDRQSSPNSAWTGFTAVPRSDDTAVLDIVNWPSGNSVELSYKLVLGTADYWQDLSTWPGTCSSTYIYNGHIRVMLE